MLACVKILASWEINLVSYLANLLTQFGEQMGQVVPPRSNPKRGATSQVNAKNHESSWMRLLAQRKGTRARVGVSRRKSPSGLGFRYMW